MVSHQKKGKRTTECEIKSSEGKISFRDNYKEKPSKETLMLGKRCRSKAVHMQLIKGRSNKKIIFDSSYTSQSW